MNEIYLGDGVNNCKLCGKGLTNSDRLRQGKCNDICENCHTEIFGVLRILKTAKDEGLESLMVKEMNYNKDSRKEK